MVELGIRVLGEDIDARHMPNVEELTQRNNVPVVSVFRELTQSLGLAERRLFVEYQGENPYHIVASDPPAVIISQELMSSLIGHELRFFLGRLLEMDSPPLLAQRHPRPLRTPDALAYPARRVLPPPNPSSTTFTGRTPYPRKNPLPVE